MSKRPEGLIAERLREIAPKLEVEDRELLLRVGRFLDDPTAPVRLVFKNKRGRPNDWQQRYRNAHFIFEHRAAHGGTLDAAYEAAAAKFPMLTARTAREHWREFGPLFRMPESNRNILLYFKGLEARGLVKINRVRKQPEK